MIIMACYELESPLQLFDKEVFEDVLSIFITSSILKLIKGSVFVMHFSYVYLNSYTKKRKILTPFCCFSNTGHSFYMES